MRALLSVSDREGLIELARGLVDAGVECYATDGTRAYLAEHDLSVAPVSELTETQEILGGRVKTLHPSIFAGLLARRDQPDHLAQLDLPVLGDPELRAASLDANPEMVFGELERVGHDGLVGPYRTRLPSVKTGFPAENRPDGRGRRADH